MINNYVNKLIENLPEESKITQKIDLVFYVVRDKLVRR